MTNKTNIPLVNDTFDIQIFWNILKKTKWIIFFVFLITFVFTILYLRYTPNIYEASSIIQINSENSSTKILDIENPYTEDQLAQSVELLKSKKMVRKVLNALPLKISYFNKGMFLSEEIYKNSPIEITYNIGSNIIFGKKIFCEYINDTSFVLTYEQAGETKSINGILNKWISILGSKIKIITINKNYFLNKDYILNKNEFYFVFNNPTQVLNYCLNNLSVSIDNYNAKTVKISFRGKNSKKIADIVNSLAHEYLAYEVERKKESSQKILEFIDKQTTKVYKSLNVTEKDIQSFKIKNNIKDYSSVNIQPEEIFTSKIHELEDNISQIDLEISAINQIQKELNKNDDINTLEIIALISGTHSEKIVTHMLDKLQNLLTQKALLLNDVTSNNRKIKLINQQFDNQRNILVDFLKTTLLRLNNTKEFYVNKVEEYKEKTLSGANYNVLELSKLNRYYKIQDQFYQKLIEKKAEYLISQAGYVSKNTVLEAAVISDIPVKPNRKIVISIAVFISFLLSFVIIILRYLFYNKISVVQELEHYTDAPIIGSIPLIDMKAQYSQLIIQEDLNSIITESFRAIRSNLDFYNLNPKGNLITVSSTISGEGKTFVAINLAGILALRNKKVVIIDLDLRKPKIHYSLNVENGKGMSRLLSGVVSLDEVINKTKIDNLDYITADQIPPNPSELIGGAKLQQVIKELKNVYDYIIIDTSPIGLVSDAIYLFKKADLPIYVLKANYSQRKFLYNLKYLRETKKIYNINLVLNGVELNTKGNRYHYGYGYAYGYDNRSRKKNIFQRIFSKS